MSETQNLLCWKSESFWQRILKVFNFRNLNSLLKPVKRWPIISIIHLLCWKLVHNVYSKICTATIKNQNVKSQIHKNLYSKSHYFPCSQDRGQTNMQKLIAQNCTAMCQTIFSTYPSSNQSILVHLQQWHETTQVRINKVIMDLEQTGFKDEVLWRDLVITTINSTNSRKHGKCLRLSVTIIFFKNKFAQWTQCWTNFHKDELNSCSCHYAGHIVLLWEVPYLTYRWMRTAKKSDHLKTFLPSSAVKNR
jgi:hypothetical protein